jgi:hypothetical protein
MLNCKLISKLVLTYLVHNVVNITFRVRCLQLLRLLLDAEGNMHVHYVSINITLALLLSKPSITH